MQTKTNRILQGDIIMGDRMIRAIKLSLLLLFTVLLMGCNPPEPTEPMPESPPPSLFVITLDGGGTSYIRAVACRWTSPLLADSPGHLVCYGSFSYRWLRPLFSLSPEYSWHKYYSDDIVFDGIAISWQRIDIDLQSLD